MAAKSTLMQRLEKLEIRRLPTKRIRIVLNFVSPDGTSESFHYHGGKLMPIDNQERSNGQRES